MIRKDQRETKYLVNVRNGFVSLGWETRILNMDWGLENTTDERSWKAVSQSGGGTRFRGGGKCQYPKQLYHALAHV